MNVGIDLKVWLGSYKWNVNKQNGLSTNVCTEKTDFNPVSLTTLTFQIVADIVKIAAAIIVFYAVRW